MNVLNGIENFLSFVNDNWTSIVIVVGLILTIYRKIKMYLGKSTEEQILIAKKQIQEIMLRLVTDAELDYSQWSEAGSVKRAEVIGQIFAKYPILSKVSDQDELISWLDESIDGSIKTMKDMFDKNTNKNN